MKTKKRSHAGPDATLLAARRFSRRHLLRYAWAAGAVIGAGPWLVRDAFSSSGEIALLMRSDYLPKLFVSRFEKRTGIKVNHTPYGSDAELVNKVKATKGRGFDLVSVPSLSARQWEPLKLLQPFDMKRVPVNNIDEKMLKGSTDHWTWDGGIYHMPYLWGTEALAWRTDKWSSEYGKLSYGDLWLPEMKGSVMGRPSSMLVGIGLYLDAIGKLPSDRMLATYKDEATMRKIWGEITKYAVERKSWLRQFWTDANSQIEGFMQNSVVLGQTWAGPALRLKTEGKPVTYMAPKEGALSWLDGLAIPAGARNFEQIYEFLKYVYLPGAGGLLASQTGYNAVGKGASRYLTAAAKKNFSEAYPGDAHDKLWWWPPEPTWYMAARGEFRDKYVTA
ncbi:MAG TPA: extracellular solute-binding protein [Rhodospirillales bacterium]